MTSPDSPEPTSAEIVAAAALTPEQILRAVADDVRRGESLASESWQYAEEFNARRLAQPDCKSCHGTGYLGTGVMTPVCACTQLSNYRIAAEMRIKKVFGKLDQSMTLASYDTGGFEQNVLARNVAINFVEHWLEACEKGWIIGFRGGVGNGKTHLANAIALALVKRHFIMPFHLSVPSMLRLERETWSADRGSGIKSPIRAAIEADLTILDDLGAEQRKAGDEERVTWAQETLYVILEERISNARPTLYTTNLSPDELRAHLGMGTAGQRLWGRIERVQVMPAVELVQVEGKHRRNIGDKDTLIRRRNVS